MSDEPDKAPEPVEAPTHSSEVSKAFRSGFKFGAYFSFKLGIAPALLCSIFTIQLHLHLIFVSPVALIALTLGGGLVGAVMSALAAALSDHTDLEEESEHPLDT